MFRDFRWCTRAGLSLMSDYVCFDAYPSWLLLELEAVHWQSFCRQGHSSLCEERHAVWRFGRGHCPPSESALQGCVGFPWVKSIRLAAE